MVDDSQIYLPFRTGDQSKRATFNKCIAEIKYWMSDNFLQLNCTISRDIVLGPRPAKIKIMANHGKTRGTSKLG